MSDNRDEITTETITASSYIVTLLQRLVSEHLLIDVSIPDSDQAPFTSTVLQVSPGGDAYVLLDDLFPQPPADQLSEKSKIRIDARFDGATLHFTTEIESVRDEEGLRLWSIAFPESIEYWQARTEHRVDVSALEIPVRIFVGEGVVLKGELQNISAQGIQLCLAKATGLKRGTGYRCSIDYSENDSVEIEIEPNRADKREGLLPVQLGAHLHNMSRQDLAQWQRFVAELERRKVRIQ